MSKQNKVNPGQYHVGGRLTQDEMARERVKQRRPASAVESAPRPKKAAAPRGAKGRRPQSAISSRASSRRP